jgi:hypothetical protein
VDLAAKKAVVAEFLGHCNRYAQAELTKYRARLAGASGMDALALEDKIVHWTAYHAFNEIALRELAEGDLDHWFA